MKKLVLPLLLSISCLSVNANPLTSVKKVCLSGWGCVVQAKPCINFVRASWQQLSPGMKQTACLIGGFSLHALLEKLRGTRRPIILKSSGEYTIRNGQVESGKDVALTKATS